MLAELDEHRYIARCEHGTIHLTWDIITFHITRDYFHILATSLQEPFAADSPVLMGNSWFSLSRRSGEGFALRIGQTELHLPKHDFFFLSQMMLRSLSVPALRKSQADGPLAGYQTLIARSEHSSKN